MAGTFNPNFNPAQVMIQGGQKPQAPTAKPITGPYLPSAPMKPNPEAPVARPMPGLNQISPPKPLPSNVLGAQAVRASGTGPYDPAYRQDLATYAGGNSVRPGGVLNLNPTGSMFGNPTGGGNAPLPGMPTDLLSQAIGGQGFSTPTPPPAAPAKPTANLPSSIQDWINSLTGSRNMFGGRGNQ